MWLLILHTLHNNLIDSWIDLIALQFCEISFSVFLMRMGIMSIKWNANCITCHDASFSGTVKGNLIWLSCRGSIMKEKEILSTKSWASSLWKTSSRKSSNLRLWTKRTFIVGVFNISVLYIFSSSLMQILQKWWIIRIIYSSKQPL